MFLGLLFECWPSFINLYLSGKRKALDLIINMTITDRQRTEELGIKYWIKPLLI